MQKCAPTHRQLKQDEINYPLFINIHKNRNDLWRQVVAARTHDTYTDLSEHGAVIEAIMSPAWKHHYR